MNRSIESVLRFVNLTTAGLLAGSLGFGDAALVPGWQEEVPRHKPLSMDELRNSAYFNAIGPVALGTAVTLAVASRDSSPARRILDAAAAIGLAGVLAATVMVTVPITKELDEQAPSDYPDDRSLTLSKNFERAHTIRTTLGIGAFICAVASNLASKRHDHAK